MLEKHRNDHLFDLKANEHLDFCQSEIDLYWFYWSKSFKIGNMLFKARFRMEWDCKTLSQSDTSSSCSASPGFSYAVSPLIGITSCQLPKKRCHIVREEWYKMDRIASHQISEKPNVQALSGSKWDSNWTIESGDALQTCRLSEANRDALP